METETRLASQEVPTSLTLHKYSLSRIDAPQPQTTQTFDKRVISIGSSPDVTYYIDDPTVSRFHCKIEGDRQGYRIRDLESKNGTFVNGVQVIESYLPKDAVIRLGNSELKFTLLDGTVNIDFHRSHRFDNLLGESLVMREIFAMLNKIAPTPATILIQGESGTGKELIAEAIHNNSDRNKGPFIIFDCSAVPANLIESEMFGHIKGAFTGATTDRKGAFEEAHGGTLFIDEIGELSLELQPKLLRVLEKGEIKAVGSNKRVITDVRIVAATNRNLKAEVNQGNFRQDLYYRLAVIEVDLPPLRERREDIPLLVKHFLKQIATKTSKEEAQISFDTMNKLQNHTWPGNVRELSNFVERAALLAENGAIKTRFIHKQLSPHDPAANSEAQIQTDAEGTFGQIGVNFDLPFKDAKNRLLDLFERSYLTRLLKKNYGNISQSAREAGIHRKSLEYLIKKLDINPREG